MNMAAFLGRHALKDVGFSDSFKKNSLGMKVFLHGTSVKTDLILTTTKKRSLFYYLNSYDFFFM